MALRADMPEILTPAQVQDLVLAPVITQSIATQVASTIQTRSATIRFPRVVQDPTAAWVAEGAEIPVSDADVDEVTADVRKLAALSIISRELADDSTPAAANIVGDGIARDITRKLNTAFFGNLAAPAPKGLAGLTGVTTVPAGTGGWTNLDAFLDAIAAAEGVNTVVNTFVANPADVLSLSKLKANTGSQVNLLQPDPTQAGRRVIAGVPLLSCADVPVGTVWGVPRQYAHIVIRDNTTLDVSRDAFFTSDRVAIRATLRVGFAFPFPAAVVKITKTA